MDKLDKVPTHLKHQPIIGVDAYKMLDGFMAGDTDARSISIGIAQWDKKANEISAKVFRHDDKHNKWSRQSEELPIHRCFDLCSLIVQAIAISKDRELSTETELKPYIVNEGMLKKIKDFYEDKEKKSLKKKIENLRNLLNEFCE